VDEEFISELMRHKNNFKINKLTLSGRSVDKLSRENEKILKSSKRIVLVFTHDFADDEFKNKAFLNLLKSICSKDTNCTIIAINKGLEKSMFKYYVGYLKSPSVSEKFDRNGYYERKSLSGRLASQVKYNCGLKEVELLTFDRSNYFWRNFFYIMPLVAYDNSKPAAVVEKLPYARDYRDPNSLRHIVIPIPDFMKTKLGFSKKNKTHNELRGGVRGNPIQSSASLSLPQNTQVSSKSKYPVQANFNYQQQESESFRDFFSSIHYNQTPDYSKRPYTSSLASATNVTSILSHNNTLGKAATNEDLNYNRSRRSQTPDILALFAPRAETVIELKQSNSTVKSHSKLSSSSQRTKEHSPSSHRVVLQGTSSYNEIDA
jgi:hypothetical protein